TKPKNSKNTARKHKQYVFNCTSKPIIIVGVGEYSDRDKMKRIRLGVVGSDDYGAGIYDISHISDKQLDRCSSYQMFLKKSFIKEIDEEEKEKILYKTEIFRDSFKEQGFDIEDSYGLFRAQAEINHYNKRKIQQNSRIERVDDSVISTDIKDK